LKGAIRDAYHATVVVARSSPMKRGEFSTSRSPQSRRERVGAGLCGALLCLLLTTGCASAGRFVWYHDLPRTDWGDNSGIYVIGIGDQIRIQVYGQDGLSTTAKIRSDGRMALPLVGEIIAVGKHPAELAAEFQDRLKEIIVAPHVTVNVDTSQPVTVTVLGEFKTVGAQSLDPSAGLLQVIAQAGGLTDFADKSRIFVLRRVPEFRRIRFTYESLLQNEGGAATFLLRTGDVVVAE